MKSHDRLRIPPTPSSMFERLPFVASYPVENGVKMPTLAIAKEWDARVTAQGRLRQTGGETAVTKSEEPGLSQFLALPR